MKMDKTDKNGIGIVENHMFAVLIEWLFAYSCGYTRVYVNLSM